jgi:hypothetical protein
MAKKQIHRCPFMRVARRITLSLAAATRNCVNALRRRGPAVEVVIADEGRRRTIKRDVERSVCRLQRAFRQALPSDIVVVVQQVIARDRQPAGCFQVGEREDGSRYAVIRLALQSNGHRLSTDEVLAALTEQCIGILAQDAKSIVVPVEFEAADRTTENVELPGDPLAAVAGAYASDNNH